MSSNITAFDITKPEYTPMDSVGKPIFTGEAKDEPKNTEDNIHTQPINAPTIIDDPKKDEDYFKSTLHSTDTIWYQDPSVLWRNYKKFFPSTRMSVVEICNSVMRLVVYSSLIIMIIERRIVLPILSILIVAIITYFLTSGSDIVNKQKQESYIAAHYSVPTENNPFMNTLVSDLNRTGKKEAAKPCDFPEVEKQIQYLYNKDVYREVDDIFNRNNSQNRFHTVPCTDNGYGVAVGDTHVFANWLYNQGRPTCKEDSRYCFDSAGAQSGKFFHLKSQPHLLQYEDEKLATKIADQISPQL